MSKRTAALLYTWGLIVLVYAPSADWPWWTSVIIGAMLGIAIHFGIDE